MDKSNDVQVGMGATLCYPQDRWPYVVIGIGKYSLKVQRLDTSGLGVTTPLGYGIADHTLKPEEYRPIGEVEHAWKHKDGCYYMGGYIRLTIGKAHYYRDYND